MIAKALCVRCPPRSDRDPRFSVLNMGAITATARLRPYGGSATSTCLNARGSGTILPRFPAGRLLIHDRFIRGEITTGFIAKGYPDGFMGRKGGGQRKNLGGRGADAQASARSGADADVDGKIAPRKSRAAYPTIPAMCQIIWCVEIGEYNIIAPHHSRRDRGCGPSFM